MSTTGASRVRPAHRTSRASPLIRSTSHASCSRGKRARSSSSNAAKAARSSASWSQSETVGMRISARSASTAGSPLLLRIPGAYAVRLAGCGECRARRGPFPRHG